jgi:hypothetical protein
MDNKTGSINFKKLNKQTIFLALAVAMFLLIGGFVVYSIIFLGKNVNDSLNTPVPSASPIQFDIKGFENLKLIR